jgi:hypothetical protein
MRDLYEQLVGGGEPAVAQLVSERRQENVALEFKTKEKAGRGEYTKADKQNLGTALSAFSNSMGGLIMWGIIAKKDDDGVDCATERQPIANIERFKSDVTRLISQAIMPRHEGIFVEAIPAQEPQGAGYLAIYVERSERRPHRCEFTKHYWKRSGDSSIMMEHYDIEDSFKRLVVPWLEVEWLITSGVDLRGLETNFRQLMIDIHLRNQSPVTARFPYLTLTQVQGAKDQPVGLYSQHRYYRGEYSFSFGANDVIHPGITLPVARLLTPEIPVEPQGGRQFRVRRGSLQPVRVGYRCGCYNSRPAEGEFTVSEEELVQLAERGISQVPARSFRA